MQASVVLGKLDNPTDIKKLQQILEELYDLNDPIYTETAPNGSISAPRGKLAIYKNGSVYEKWQNIDGETTWSRIDADTPWEVDGTETQLVTADEIDMQSKKIINLTDGVDSGDAVNKGQLDAGVSRAATKIVAASDSIDTTHADYTCDGVEDDVQINAAIAACTSGGRVILLEGTYSISLTIDLDVDDIVLEGQGWGTKLEGTTNLDSPIVQATADRVTLKNMLIDDITKQDIPVKWASGADYGKIEGCKMVVSMTTGINALLVDDCNWLRVLNNHISISTGGANTEGIVSIQGDSLYMIFEGNTIDGSACSVNVTCGITGNGTTSAFAYSTIKNNIIIGEGTNLDFGVYFQANAVYSNNIISDNVFYNMGTEGIQLEANTSENIVDGNMARDGITDNGTNNVIGDNNTG